MRGAARAAALVVWTALAVGGPACDTGAGVGGCPGAQVAVNQGGYTFPAKRIVKGGLHVRVTQNGFDRVADNVRALFLALLPTDDKGRAIVSLDALGLGELGTELGPLDAELRDLTLALDLDSLTIALVPGSAPAEMVVTITDATVGLADGVVAGGVDSLLLTGDLGCRLTDGPSGQVARLDLTIRFTIATDLSGNLALDVLTTAVDLKDLDLGIVADCDLPECLDGLSLGDDDECTECELVCGASDFTVGVMETLAELLDGPLDALASTLGVTLADTVLDLLLDGRPLAVEGELDVARWLEPLVPSYGRATPMGLLGRPTGDAFRVTGEDAAGDLALDTTLDTGVDAPASPPCVGTVDVEPGFLAGPPPTFPGTLQGGEPYALAVATSEALVNAAYWAVHRSGLTCLDLRTEDLARLTVGELVLTAGTFELVVPGLTELLGADAPMRLRLRPRLEELDDVGGGAGQGAPRWIRFEPGDRVGAAKARLGLGDATLGIDVSLGGVWVHAVGVETDLEAALVLEPLPGARVGVRVDALALGELTLGDEALSAHARLDELVPFVVDLVLGTLETVTDALSLELETAGLFGELLGQAGVDGVALEPVLREIRVAGSGGERWLVLLVALEPAAPPMPMAAWHASFESVELAASLDGRVGMADGTVPLALPASASQDVRVQVRPVGGGWSPWVELRPGGRVAIPHAGALGLGPRGWELRARAPGEDRLVTRALGSLTLVPPVEASGPPHVGAAGLGEDATASVGVADEGCSGAGAGSVPGLAWALGLLLALRASTTRRRVEARRLAAWVPAVLLATAGCAGATAPERPCETDDQCPDDYLCGDAGVCMLATPCGASTDCCPGATCFHGWCRPTERCDVFTRPCDGLGEVCEEGTCAPAPCALDGDCPSGTVCSYGRCLRAPPCGGGCEPGWACHVPSGRCVPAAEGCAACAEGELASVDPAVEAEVPRLGCADVAWPCGCRVAAPAPTGRPGLDLTLLATPGGVTAVSRDVRYGDLVSRRYSEDALSFDDVALDGVPSGPVVADGAGYRGGVVAEGPDRGHAPSAVVSQDALGTVVDTLHRDAGTGGLRHVRFRPLTGDRLVSAEVPVAGDAGRASCVARDAVTGRLRGVVHVRTGEAAPATRLVAIESSVEAPTGPEDWESVLLTEREAPLAADPPCGGACEVLEACVRDGELGEDRCVGLLGVGACGLECPPHHLCVSGESDGAGVGGADRCLPTVDATAARDTSRWGVGVELSCVATTTALEIVWFDADHGALRHARWLHGQPPPLAAFDEAAEPVDGRVIVTPEPRDDAPSDDAGPSARTGRHPDVAVDPSGRVAVVYQDEAAGVVRFARRLADDAPWVRETALEAAIDGEGLDLGAWSRLVYRPPSDHVIVHVDSTRGAVLLGRRDAQGCWRTAELLGGTGDGDQAETWAFPDVAVAADGTVWVGAVSLRIDDDGRPAPELRVLAPELPSCAGR